MAKNFFAIFSFLYFTGFLFTIGGFAVGSMSLVAWSAFLWYLFPLFLWSLLYLLYSLGDYFFVVILDKGIVLKYVVGGLLIILWIGIMLIHLGIVQLNLSSLS